MQYLIFCINSYNSKKMILSRFFNKKSMKYFDKPIFQSREKFLLIF